MTVRYCVVICRADRPDEKTPGEYICATHRLFTANEAAAAYAKGVARSREPRVVGAVEYLRLCECFREG